MMDKVKTIKQYLKEGPPKFSIISRRKSSAVLYVHIINSGFEDGKKYSGKDIELQIEPPESGLGLIKDVVRISDGVTFSSGEDIDSERGIGHLVSFNEDKIHCDIAYIFEQNLITTDIDFIYKTPTLEDIGGESDEDE